MNNADKAAKAVTLSEMISGRLVDLTDPDPATIAVEDIFHWLANSQRWGGHLPPNTWTVADHVLLVRDLVLEAGYPELGYAALHHDSPETYTGDLPTPWKNAMGGPYRRAYETIEEAVCTALNIDRLEIRHEIVVDADRAAIHMEGRAFLRSKGANVTTPLPVTVLMDDRPLKTLGYAGGLEALYEAHDAEGGLGSPEVLSPIADVLMAFQRAYPDLFALVASQAAADASPPAPPAPPSAPAPTGLRPVSA